MDVTEAAELAKQRMSRFHRPNYLIARLFFEPSIAWHFFALFEYLRWIDDVVDSVEGTRDTRLSFIRGQRRFLKHLYQGTSPSPSNVRLEMQWAHIFVSFDRGIGEKLRPHLFDLMYAIEFDAEKRGMIPDEDALYHAMLLEGRSLVEIAQYFASPRYAYPQRPEPSEAIACVLSHNLHDFIDDVRVGHFNISREEVAKYAVDLGNEADEGLRLWARDKTEGALQMMAAGQQEARRFQPLRCRMAHSLVCAKYINVLKGIRANNYRLVPSAHQPKDRVGRLAIQASWVLLSAVVQHPWWPIQGRGLSSQVRNLGK